MHQKHKNLIKPIGGQFGRNELAILGAPCGEIKRLVAQLGPVLSNSLEVAYVDADHHATENKDWSALGYGISSQLTNKISHFSLEFNNRTSHYFNAADLVLVNGNHFKADSQIAWVHPDKSLEKKLDKLTNVSLVLVDEGIEIPGFLKEHLAEQNYTIIKRSDLDKIIEHIKTYITSHAPQLNGLVLVGGKSTRMKKDKSHLIFHGDQPQYARLNSILDNYCENVFISARDIEQSKQFDAPVITDKFVGLGPFGGILSAFQENPNTAWLVVAVDLPFLNTNTIEVLVENRNLSKVATSFIDQKNEFPEPLITIWEPRAYPVLLNFLARGYSCPRKVLINSDVEIIKDRDSQSLTNVNSPVELKEALNQINVKSRE